MTHVNVSVSVTDDNKAVMYVRRPRQIRYVNSKVMILGYDEFLYRSMQMLDV